MSQRRDRENQIMCTVIVLIVSRLFPIYIYLFLHRLPFHRLSNHDAQKNDLIIYRNNNILKAYTMKHTKK